MNARPECRPLRHLPTPASPNRSHRGVPPAISNPPPHLRAPGKEVCSQALLAAATADAHTHGRRHCPRQPNPQLLRRANSNLSPL